MKTAKEQQKTAKEMFEELGYECNENEWDLTYSKTIINNQFYTSPITINFRKMIDETIEKYDFNGNSVPINLLELKAINQQCKELGWNNE